MRSAARLPPGQAQKRNADERAVSAALELQKMRSEVEAAAAQEQKLFTVVDGERVLLTEELMQQMLDSSHATGGDELDRRRASTMGRGASKSRSSGKSHPSRSCATSCATDAGGAVAGEDNEGGWHGDGDSGGERFLPAEPLALGRVADAALGLQARLGLESRLLYERLSRGYEAIVTEFRAAASAEEWECLDYVLNQRAGSSPKCFANCAWARDCDQAGVRADRQSGGLGLVLADFVNAPEARRAKLEMAHVLALRLYTTICFRCLNAPLREQGRTAPHPFAATVHFLAAALLRLRNNHDTSHDAASPPRKQHTFDVWRGMRNVCVCSGDDLRQTGGTELACMSTTADVAVALSYATPSRSA